MLEVKGGDVKRTNCVGAFKQLPSLILGRHFHVFGCSMRLKREMWKQNRILPQDRAYLGLSRAISV
jgi:hypothetical protein